MLEDEAQKIREMRAAEGQTASSGRPAATAGLTRRFGSLNKAAQAIQKKPPVEQFRGTNEPISETNAKQFSNNSETVSETTPKPSPTEPKVESLVEMAVKAPAGLTIEFKETPTPTMGISEEEPSGSSITNAKQFSNNSETIAKQKTYSEPLIAKQNSNNSATIPKQISNKSNDKRNDSETIPNQFSNRKRNADVTIPKQLRSDSETNLVSIPASLSRLSGHKLSIVRAIFDLCSMNGSRISGAVSRETLVSMTGAGPEVVRVTADRLEKEGCIKTVESKRGRGGWTVFELDSELYNQLVTHDFRNTSATYPKQLRNNSVTESETQSETIAPSKLDSNLNSTNSLTEDGLDEVDFSNCKIFGITKSIIQDIRKNSWRVSRFQLETHIDRFINWAGDPSNRKGINNLRGFFCGNLKRISESGEDPLDWVRTPEDMAIEQILSEKKARLEQLKAQKAEELEIDFQTWLLNTPEVELREKVPGNLHAQFGSEIHKNLVRDFYHRVVRNQTW